jgi:phosphoglycolate phosphatase
MIGDPVSESPPFPTTFLPMTTSPPSVLFDLDGTLADSLQDLAETMNQVLTGLGHPSYAVEAYKTLVGDGVVKLVERCLPDAQAADPEYVQQAVQAMKEEYARRWKNHAAPYPGIRDMLDGLRERGVRCGVLSNKPEAFTREMVTFLFPDIPFATVRGAREGIPVKPDPTSARQICTEWNTSPSDVVYVGDTNTDMRTGRSAGFHTVGVTWGFRDRDELRTSGAHVIIDTPRELLALVDHFPRSFSGGSGFS